MDLLNTFLEQAFMAVLLCSGIPLLICSLAGLVVAVIQTAMQVQEQSTVFLIKLAIFVGTAFIGAETFFRLLTTYFQDSIGAVAALGKLL